MTWPILEFTKGEVNKAGAILVNSVSNEEREWAYRVLSNWRACHGYPLNAFQAALRNKLKRLGMNDTLVAQRLKRTPSIVDKLRQEGTMKLATMQDVGGIRVIVPDLPSIRILQESYRKKGHSRHQLRREKDYISEPRPISGYRSAHMVFEYKIEGVKGETRLLIELQIRTKLQHAWATAVETIDTFLKQRLKAEQGDPDWCHFFAVTASAFAYLEGSPLVPGYASLFPREIFKEVVDAETRLSVLLKLKTFSQVVENVDRTRKAHYHLITLNTSTKQVSVVPYSRNNLPQAESDYSRAEASARQSEPIEAVLVSAGQIATLRRAYPNYFLDTAEFIRQVADLIARARTK